MPNLWTEAATVAQTAYSDVEQLDAFAGVNTAVVQLVCDWADRYTVVNDIIGNAKTWPLGGSVTAVAIKAAIRGVQNSAYTTTNGTIGYAQAQIDITYSNQTEEAQTGAEDSTAFPDLKYVDSIEPTIEFQKLDFNQFRWDGGDRLDEREAPARQLRGLSLVRTIYGFTTLPADTLSLVGKVNEDAYTSSLLGLAFAPETLLFTPPSISQNVQTDGSVKRTATIKMIYKPETWNKFWRAKTQTYVKMQKWDGAAWTDYDNYPVADMGNWLFA
jgi:hypothetical protein